MRVSTRHPVLLSIGLLLSAFPAACVGDTDAHPSFEERIVPRGDGGAACSPTGDAPDGYPCGCDGECAPGALCVTESEAGYPGGLCFRICTVGAGECTEGAECVDIGAGPDQGVCRPLCSTNEDCPPANSCDGTHCRSLCQDDAECLSGHCDPYLDSCTDGTPTDGGDVFASCLRHEDCKSEFCSPGLQLCVSNCSVERQGCPEGAVCERVASGSDLGVCFPVCDSAADCPDSSFTCGDSVVFDQLLVCIP